MSELPSAARRWELTGRRGGGLSAGGARPVWPSGWAPTEEPGGRGAIPSRGAQARVADAIPSAGPAGGSRPEVLSHRPLSEIHKNIL